MNKERWKKLAQKAGDKIRQGSLRLAMLMTTLIGNGSATGSNPPAESSSSSEKTTITAPAVKTERADSIDTVDMTQLMSEQLISSNKNIAGNFNLEGRTFTAEELAEIGQCELNEQIQKTAQKTAKRGVPKKGQQTYCQGTAAADGRNIAGKTAAGLKFRRRRSCFCNRRAFFMFYRKAGFKPRFSVFCQRSQMRQRVYRGA